MQRRLVLMRHGHSEAASDDFPRVLSQAGQRAARQAASALAGSGFSPELVISSAAPRALETAEIVARELGYDKAIQARQELYLGSEVLYVAAIRKVHDACRSLLVVGHNPDLSLLARRFGTPGELAPAAYCNVSLDLPSWRDFRAFESRG